MIRTRQVARKKTTNHNHITCSHRSKDEMIEDIGKGDNSSYFIFFIDDNKPMNLNEKQCVNNSKFYVSHKNPLQRSVFCEQNIEHLASKLLQPINLLLIRLCICAVFDWLCWGFITKTYLYNFDPLKPYFYIVKLGFTGVYIIFLISAQKHRLWVLVRTASMRRFSRVSTIYVLSRNMQNIRIFIWKLSFFGGEIFNIFE